jgi:hypothetical protein
MAMQWPLIGVHSIMMEKSTQSGNGGGLLAPPPFTLSTITSKEGRSQSTYKGRGEIKGVCLPSSLSYLPVLNESTVLSNPFLTGCTIGIVDIVL